MLRCASVFLAILGAFLLADSVSATAQVQVDSTNPSAAPQGTINLDVTISGNGTVQIGGVVYAPAAAVNVSGNGDSANTVGGGYVAYRVRVAKGNLRGWYRVAVDGHVLDVSVERLGRFRSRFTVAGPG